MFFELEKYINVPSFLIAGICTLFMGGHDELAHVLTMLMIFDYCTGLISGFMNKRLDSRVGFIGICKKVLMLLTVAVAVEVNKLIPDVAIRDFIIYFYIANEGISILENVCKFIPVPDKMKEYFEQLRGGVQHE